MPRGYVIRNGDTLDAIATEFYGQAGVSLQLAQYNGILNPHEIRPRRHILIPSYIELTGQETGQVGANKPPHGLNAIIEKFGNIYDFIRCDGTLYWKWEDDYMTRCEIPFAVPLSVYPALFTNQIYCHRELADLFSGVFEKIYRQGSWKAIASYGGCFQYGYDLHSGKISPHAWGIAIDLNVESNALGSEGDMDPDIIELFAESGFQWGGDWPGRFRDPMHFQYCTGY